MQRRERVLGFTETIWRWFTIHKRALPWRDLPVQDDAERGYRILVSEVMLQQTQVPRVIVLYPRFLGQFPTLATLARASNADVIRAWRGMGYNSRALRLRDACRTIMDRYGGIFPKTMEELEAIKGIGHYTAAAIRNFAFNLPTPCVDTNIRRILHRTFVGPERPDGTWEKDDKYLLNIAEEVLCVAVPLNISRFSLARHSLSSQTSNEQPANELFPRDARNWHAALMDFGSLVQTKKNPKWEECPLTAKGLMMATPANYLRSQKKSYPLPPTPYTRREPGREIAGRFVPNRIVRGRIVEVLRQTPSGLSLNAIGRRVALDWSLVAHHHWLEQILKRLEQDALVARRTGKFTLAD